MTRTFALFGCAVNTQTSVQTGMSSCHVFMRRVLHTSYFLYGTWHVLVLILIASHIHNDVFVNCFRMLVQFQATLLTSTNHVNFITIYFIQAIILDIRISSDNYSSICCTVMVILFHILNKLSVKEHRIFKVN